MRKLLFAIMALGMALTTVVAIAPAEPADAATWGVGSVAKYTRSGADKYQIKFKDTAQDGHCIRLTQSVNYGSWSTVSWNCSGSYKWINVYTDSHIRFRIHKGWTGSYETIYWG